MRSVESNQSKPTYAEVRGEHDSSGSHGVRGSHGSRGACGARGAGNAGSGTNGTNGANGANVGSTPCKRVGKGVFLIAAGLALLVAAACLVGYNLWDEWHAGRASAEALAQLEDLTPLSDAISADEADQAQSMPIVVVDGHGYVGTLSIDALDLELPVISEWSYPALKVAPCRYAGTPYAGNFVIAAHNYASHFGRLKSLEVGDEVRFCDADGNVFRYRVSVIDVLAPDAVQEMTAGEWPLSLFTCTLDSASRVTVRCEQI